MNRRIYFHTAPWCAQCRRLRPTVQRIAVATHSTLIEVNIEKEQPVLPNIMSLPTVVIQDADTSEIVAIFSADMITAPALRKVLS